MLKGYHYILIITVLFWLKNYPYLISLLKGLIHVFFPTHTSCRCWSNCSRHLQALASVDSVTEVVAVDPSDSSLIEPDPYGLKLKAQVIRLYPLFPLLTSLVVHLIFVS